LAAVLQAGRRVAVLRRGVVPVATYTTFAVDRRDGAALRNALAAFQPTVVIDFACFNRADAKGLVAALPASIRQVVFVSTVDVYGVPLPRFPMTEPTPWAAPGGTYAAEKLLTEQALKDWLAKRNTALTVVRPTYSMGQRFVISLFDRCARNLITRLRQGLPVPIPSPGLVGHAQGMIHPSDATDTGRMIAMVAGAPQAWGQDYTVGSPGTTMTHLAYVNLIAKVVGVTARPVTIPRSFLTHDPSVPLDSLYRELTRFDLSYCMDKFISDFPGFIAAPDLEACVRGYLEAVDFQTGTGQPAQEDQIIKAWGSGS
jgi:nucleoside-diphosphate-sugar epimerase